ncbi:winged helix-turn-helix transcriptional regulator [Ectothiorhodospiraceae bacterium WFHF3C12]|nr:winged helix-turn-helix transcriptional regulator [Ectothiorhodospiraceae bacterium WFHF3C12]
MNESNDQLITEAVLEVFRANGSLIAWGDRFAAPFGLTSARWQMLGALAMAGAALTTPRIAGQMGVTRQGARKQLARLQADGLVRARSNPHHQRSALFELTDAGAQLYARIDEAWRNHARGLSGDMEPADLQAALRVLRSFQRRHELPADSGDSQ